MNALNLGGAIEILRVVFLNSVAPDVNFTIIGDIHGATGDVWIAVGGIKRNEPELLAIIHRHARIGRAEVHADDHGGVPSACIGYMRDRTVYKGS